MKKETADTRRFTPIRIGEDRRSSAVAFFFVVFVFCSAISARVKTGLDVMVDQDFKALAGKRVAVITNHSSLTYDGKHIVNLLAANTKLVAIFSPEHGFSGTAADGKSITSSKHEGTGVPIYSLYQPPSYRPPPEMIQNVDALVYDIQDVGARFYTFITTLGYTLEAAAKAKIPYYVLDRPNPINGVGVEGPLLDQQHFSFVGYMRMPIRHGMTVGELARLYNGENKLGAELHVIEMQGWKRSMWYDETGLSWVNPSPNIRNLTQAILYPGACLLEGRQFSVGRGTDSPFEIVGAPWLKGQETADYLNALKIPGVKALARRFRPTDAPLKDQDCDGLDIQLTDRDKLDSVRMGLEIVAAVIKLHPGKYDPKTRMTIIGSDAAAARLANGESGSAVNASLAADITAFKKTREKYLIYK